jgi:hypothetical protein
MTATDDDLRPARTRYERRAPQPPRGRGRVLLARLNRRTDHLLGLEEPAGPVRTPTSAYVLFALAVLFYPVHQLLTRGELLLSGSMWAEMGTNYYATTQDPSLVQRLFATDAGYIPLPQRLIALAGGTLGIPPATVPFLYAGSAILLAALLIASFCLPVFRAVVTSDGMRFVLAITLMLVPDYETRTFINFTYFAVVPIVAVTALAAVQRDRDVPAWAWILPVFMLSKPGVLAALPAMVLVAVVSRPRFRWITLVSVVAGLIQAFQLALSSSSGSSLLQASDQSALSKLITALKYTLGFTGRLVLGPGTTLGAYPLMFAGLVVLVASVAATVFLRSRAAPLVWIGLSLILFTMLIDTFSFSAAFTRDLAMLSNPSFDRRFVVALIGALFVVTGLVAMLVEGPRTAAAAARLGRFPVARMTSVVGTAVLAAWLFLAGWSDYAAVINRTFGVPVANVSQWEQMSPLINSGEPVVCVPLDPFSWVYGRNCDNLSEKVIPFYYGWRPTQQEDGTSTVDLTVPREVRGSKLASLGVLVRPQSGMSTVSGRAVVTDDRGRETVLTAEGQVPPDGGLLQFLGRPTPLIENARSVRLEFDDGVDVAAVDPSAVQTTIVLWMGQPGSGS